MNGLFGPGVMADSRGLFGNPLAQAKQPQIAPQEARGAPGAPQQGGNPAQGAPGAPAQSQAPDFGREGLMSAGLALMAGRNLGESLMYGRGSAQEAKQRHKWQQAMEGELGLDENQKQILQAMPQDLQQQILARMMGAGEAGGPKVTLTRDTSEGQFRVEGTPADVNSMLPRLPEALPGNESGWQLITGPDGVLQRVNPNTGQVGDLERELIKPEDVYQRVQIQNQISTNYARATDHYRTAADAYARGMAGAREQNIAGDTALLFNTLQMMAPRIRLNEQSISQLEQTGGLPSWIVSLYGKSLQGTQVLDPASRREIVRTMEALAGEMRQGYQHEAAPYQEWGRQSGVATPFIVDPFRPQPGPGARGMRTGGVLDNY